MTFLRIWRTGLDLSRIDDYERFVDERSRPMFQAQSGFRGVMFCRSDDEIAVLSFWKNRDAIDALDRSETYQQAVTAITASGFLTADSTVDVLEIESSVLPAGDDLFRLDQSDLTTTSHLEAAEVAADYDRIADDYVRHVYNELDGKPFDREFLDSFAVDVGEGRVCEIGCGPGQVARYLHERGCDIFGLDISPRMTELARALNPDIEFRTGDFRSLGATEDSLAGIVSFYSLIHLDSAQLAPTFAGLRRALRIGGRLVVAVHEGCEARQPDEMWGIPVALKFSFFTVGQLASALGKSGFKIERVVCRPPYRDVEAETNRVYISAIATATSEDQR